MTRAAAGPMRRLGDAVRIDAHLHTQAGSTSTQTPKVPLMNADGLAKTAQAMVAGRKGLLAMDESNETCNKRFADAGIPQTVEARRAWRELILTTPGLGDFINGAILFDETLGQGARDGTPFLTLMAEAGILPGIKVDLGAKDLAAFPGEKVTEGLDGLRARLQGYAAKGARFAKWRAVIRIGTTGDGEAMPSAGCIGLNAHALARYAALCQEAGLVPIVEPEVLMDGDHSLARCAEVTEAVLQRVFEELSLQRVLLEGMILKPSMVTAGADALRPSGVDDAADATVRCLLRTVPAAVPGIAFLSGGQSGRMAAARLNAMHLGTPASTGTRTPLPPWPLTFSFARAIQFPALQIWAGQDANRDAAQRALLHRAGCNRAAVRGEYDAAADAA